MVFGNDGEPPIGEAPTNLTDTTAEEASEIVDNGSVVDTSEERSNAARTAVADSELGSVTLSATSNSTGWLCEAFLLVDDAERTERELIDLEPGEIRETAAASTLIDAGAQHTWEVPAGSYRVFVVADGAITMTPRHEDRKAQRTADGRVRMPRESSPTGPLSGILAVTAGEHVEASVRLERLASVSIQLGDGPFDRAHVRLNDDWRDQESRRVVIRSTRKVYPRSERTVRISALDPGNKLLTVTWVDGASYAIEFITFTLHPGEHRDLGVVTAPISPTKRIGLVFLDSEGVRREIDPVPADAKLRLLLKRRGGGSDMVELPFSHEISVQGLSDGFLELNCEGLDHLEDHGLKLVRATKTIDVASQSTAEFHVETIDASLPLRFTDASGPVHKHRLYFVYDDGLVQAIRSGTLGYDAQRREATFTLAIPATAARLVGTAESVVEDWFIDLELPVDDSPRILPPGDSARVVSSAEVELPRFVMFRTEDMPFRVWPWIVRGHELRTGVTLSGIEPHETLKSSHGTCVRNSDGSWQLRE